jgi:hypothetical protein
LGGLLFRICKTLSCVDVESCHFTPSLGGAAQAAQPVYDPLRVRCRDYLRAEVVKPLNLLLATAAPERDFSQGPRQRAGRAGRKFKRMGEDRPAAPTDTW